LKIILVIVIVLNNTVNTYVKTVFHLHGSERI